mgnify:CR=1 FL=1
MIGHMIVSSIHSNGAMLLLLRKEVTLPNREG